MTSYLGRILEYNTWATQGLLDFLAKQPPETLDLAAGGTYGTIRATLEHLLTSELSYQRRLAGLPRYDPKDRPERPDLADLQRLADESAAALAAADDALPDPGTMLPTSTGKRAAATILTQLGMHAIEHRAAVRDECRLLRAGRALGVARCHEHEERAAGTVQLACRDDRGNPLARRAPADANACGHDLYLQRHVRGGVVGAGPVRRRSAGHG
jgi:uncharacterized damage-inducible protein DinB